MRFLPLFLDLRAGKVALIGSGPAAVNKLRLLRAAGADVRWYSDDVDVAEEMLLASRPPGRLELSLADPLQASFREFRLVVAATGTALDDAVAALARTVNVPVNVVDRPELSSFIFPAIVDRGEVVVAIGTGGASPVLARRLRERIEAILPARVGELATLLRRYRGRLSIARDGAHKVRRFWERAVDGPVGAAALAGRGGDAEAALIRDIADLRKERAPTGTVHLVGAGPGDPDLLTLRALHVLQGADVVFYDELVTPEILDRARRDAERVFVGKRRGAPGIGQDDINRRLRDAARGGLNVVRLKGGDPFMFGRGGEELDYLRRHDVPVIVVPGHHRGARLRGRSRAAADVAQRGEPRCAGHRPSRRRRRNRRLVRPRRSLNDRRRLHGALGRRFGARRADRRRPRTGDPGRRSRARHPPRCRERRRHARCARNACRGCRRRPGCHRRRQCRRVFRSMARRACRAGAPIAA